MELEWQVQPRVCEFMERTLTVNQNLYLIFIVLAIHSICYDDIVHTKVLGLNREHGGIATTQSDRAWKESLTFLSRLSIRRYQKVKSTERVLAMPVKMSYHSPTEKLSVCTSLESQSWTKKPVCKLHSFIPVIYVLELLFFLKVMPLFRNVRSHCLNLNFIYDKLVSQQRQW